MAPTPTPWKTFENSKLEFPVLVHCLSGKDRTGIVICVILLIIGIEKKIIIEEYLLSEGEVKIEWIQLAIDGVQNVDTYLNRVGSWEKSNKEKVWFSIFWINYRPKTKIKKMNFNSKSY